LRTLAASKAASIPANLPSDETALSETGQIKSTVPRETAECITFVSIRDSMNNHRSTQADKMAAP
ncbi:hypothetical protein K7432_013458, partial [Basidiobolus ranarum]